jgi:hypothetical protein
MATRMVILLNFKIHEVILLFKNSFSVNTKVLIVAEKVWHDLFLPVVFLTSLPTVLPSVHSAVATMVAPILKISSVLCLRAFAPAIPSSRKHFLLISTWQVPALCSTQIPFSQKRTHPSTFGSLSYSV